MRGRAIAAGPRTLSLYVFLFAAMPSTAGGAGPGALRRRRLMDTYQMLHLAKEAELARREKEALSRQRPLRRELVAEAADPILARGPQHQPQSEQAGARPRSLARDSSTRSERECPARPVTMARRGFPKEEALPPRGEQTRGLGRQALGRQA